MKWIGTLDGSLGAVDHKASIMTSFLRRLTWALGLNMCLRLVSMLLSCFSFLPQTVLRANTKSHIILSVTFYKPASFLRPNTEKKYFERKSRKRCVGKISFTHACRLVKFVSLFSFSLLLFLVMHNNYCQ